MDRIIESFKKRLNREEKVNIVNKRDLLKLILICFVETVNNK